MSKSPYTPEGRALVAQEYLDGKASSYELAQMYNILLSFLAFRLTFCELLRC